MVYKKGLVLAGGLALLLSSFVGIALLGDAHKHVGVFLILYGLSFLFWGVCIYATQHSSDETLAKFTPWFCSTAGVIAVLLLLSLTSMSTDIYRYIWDGGLTTFGVNPYLVTPENVHIPQLRESALYSLLDWKDQYTVYPPLAQLLFVGAFFLYSTVDILGAKILFAGGAALSAFLFYRMLPRRFFLLAIVNPLFLFESFNGGHLDNYLVALMLATWYFFTGKKYTIASILLAVAILIKLYPVIFLPLFAYEVYRRSGLRSALYFSSLCMGIVCVFYVPLVPHLSFLVSRYADWVEVMAFNASLYRIVFSLCAYVVQNPAVWASRICALLLVCAIGFLSRRSLTPATLFLAVLALFVCSSVVYPWYTLVVIPFVFLITAKNEGRPSMYLYMLALMQLLVSLTYISESTLPLEFKYQLLRYAVVLEYSILVSIVLTLWYGQTLLHYFRNPQKLV